MKENKQVNVRKLSFLELNGMSMSYCSAKETIINKLEKCFLLLFKVSQTLFDHISINSLMILTVLMAMEGPQKDLLIDTSHVLRQSILAELLRKSVGNHHSTTY